MPEKDDKIYNLEDDENTSINKKIEELDKNDPNYNAKRNHLIEQLKITEKQMLKLQKSLRKQQNEARIAIKFLSDYAPINKDIKQMMEKIAEDKIFITRALAETIAARGSNKNELLRLKSSQEFNQPIDAKIITDIDLRPLPSSKPNRKKERLKENIKNNQNSKKPLTLAQRILDLRSPTSKIHMTKNNILKTRNKEYS